MEPMVSPSAFSALDSPSASSWELAIKAQEMPQSPSAEKIRHGFDAQVSEADLYGTYLRAFRYVISHIQPAAVMGAYNAVNGEPCCASPTLLQKILRGI